MRVVKLDRPVRSAFPTNPSRCQRRTLGAGLPALLLMLFAGCATAPPPPPPVVAPPPPPAPPPVIEPVASPVITPPPIEIHQADLHGQFESKQAGTITIHALLMMTKTRPEVGNKGTLFCSPSGKQGDDDWVPLGEVEIKKPLDADGNLQVKIIDDEKKFVIPGGKKPSPLVRKTRLKLRWEW